MSPDSVILIQLCILAMAIFTALHFAWQAEYYKKRAEKLTPKHGPDGRFVSKRIGKAIDMATEMGRDDLVLKLRGQA